MVLTLHVKKIEGYQDVDGKPGKLVELVEQRPFIRPPIRAPAEITQVVEGTVQALQTALPGVMVAPKSIGLTKMILLLTEEESERLGVKFEVNKQYRVELKDQKIEFKRVSD